MHQVTCNPNTISKCTGGVSLILYRSLLMSPVDVSIRGMFGTPELLRILASASADDHDFFAYPLSFSLVSSEYDTWRLVIAGRTCYEKNEEIWLSPMTKAPTNTMKGYGNREHQWEFCAQSEWRNDEIASYIMFVLIQSELLACLHTVVRSGMVARPERNRCIIVRLAQ